MKKVRVSECCGEKIIFNHATGDEVCSLCRNPTKSASVVTMEMPEGGRDDG